MKYKMKLPTQQALLPAICRELKRLGFIRKKADYKEVTYSRSHKKVHVLYKRNEYETIRFVSLYSIKCCIIVPFQLLKKVNIPFLYRLYGYNVNCTWVHAPPTWLIGWKQTALAASNSPPKAIFP